MAKLSEEGRDARPAREFAVPEPRKAPIGDAGHVRRAAARFDQVRGVADAGRDQARTRIEAAANRFGAGPGEDDRRDLGD